MAHKIPSYYRYVESITVTNAGSGYDPANPPTIIISGGGGTGATATPIISLSGELTGVTVTNSGNGYTSTPTATLSSGTGTLTVVLNFATGPSSEHTEINAINVKHTLPEFIREDYDKFVTFIEKYYTWMEQANNPINLLLNKRYSDIDYANDAELEKWRLALASKWPQKIPTDKKFFYKRIKDIYESKGTKASTEAFFRLFYGEDVDVIYPSRYVLRASDGIWSKPQSVSALSANDYEVLNLQGKLIDVHYYETENSVTRVKTLPASVTDVLKISYTSPQRYEVYLKFDVPRNTLPGPGADGVATPVYEGPIDTVDTVGAADASRAAGTYTIGASDWTSDGAGTLAEFSVVVDGAGDATITITTDGEGFVVDETITIADADLGGGGGADLTFDVATLVEGELKINDLTVTDAGQDYLAAPAVTITDSSGGTGAEITAKVEDSVITGYTVTNKGSGYTSSTVTVTLDTSSVNTFVTIRGDAPTSENTKAILGRSLTSISPATYTGSDAGFSEGDVVTINEAGDDAIGYALDYFAEDYVIVGGTNDSFARVLTVDSLNAPATWTTITPGYGFNKGATDLTVTSPTGETVTVTMTTGYLFSYSGQYIDDRGKLSDVNRLQDNARYQSYSYIIKSSQPQSDWGQTLKDTIHPAGWEVFGDLVITSEIDFSDISIDSPGYHIRFFEDDTFANEGGEATDILIVEYFKPVADTATATEAVAKLVEKPVDDATTNVREGDAGDQTYFAEDYVDNDFYVQEGGFYVTLHKVFDQDETATATESLVPVVSFVRSFTETPAVSEVVVTELTYGRDFSETVSIVDNGLTLTWNKDFSDTASASETSVVYETGLNKSDSATTSQSVVINTSNVATDTASVSEADAKEFTTSRSDSATTSDSGSITGPPDYVDATYFAEDYTVGTSLGSF